MEYLTPCAYIEDLLEEIFDFMVRDFSGYALAMVLNHDLTEIQEELFSGLIKKPHRDGERFNRLWEGEVYSLKDAYTMAP